MFPILRWARQLLHTRASATNKRRLCRPCLEILESRNLPSIGPASIITTVAGNGVYGYGGDGGPATAALLGAPYGVAVDNAGHLFITDHGNSRVREVNLATGVITTVAGNGVYGYDGDGGPATAASMRNPTGVAVDASEDLFIAEIGNHAVRMVANQPSFVVTTLDDSGPGSLRAVITAVNSDPIANGADQITFASDISGGTISLLSPLPALTRDQVSINGPVVLSGGNSVAGDGLDLSGSHDSIQSVTVAYFGGAGISITGDHDSVAACLLTGNLDGIDISNTTGVMIGGTNPGVGNTITLNKNVGINLIDAQTSTIQGNWIGTDSCRGGAP